MRHVLPVLVILLLAGGVALLATLMGEDAPSADPGVDPALEQPLDPGPGDAGGGVDLAGADVDAGGARESRPEGPAPAGRADDGGQADPVAAPAARGWLTGRLVGPEGEAVADATVVAHPEWSGFGGPPPGTTLERVEVRSKEDGSFRLRAPSGPVAVRVTADHHAPHRETLHLVGGQTFERGDVVLGAGARVLGLVTDPAGRPLEGVQVHRVNAGGPGTWISDDTGAVLAETDAEGRFRIPGMALGAFQLRLRHPGYPDLDLSGEVARPREAVELEARLRDGASIEGVVREVPADAPPLEVVARPQQEGENTPGVFVVLGDGGPVGAAERTGAVQPDGTFAVHGLLPDRTYSLNVRQREGAPRSSSWSRAVEAPAGDRGVVLVADGGATLTWRAVDALTGEPVEAYLALAGYGEPRPVMDDTGDVATHHPQGRGRMDRLRAPAPEARAELRLEAPGYAPLVRGDLSLSTGLPLDLGDLPLSRAPKLTLAVVDEVGEPVEGAELRLRPTPDPGGDDFRRVRVRQVGSRVMLGDERFARTDAAGEAVLTLPEGADTVDLVVTHPEHAELREVALPVPAGEDLRHAVLLVRGAVAVVQVLDASGQPQDGVQVEHRTDGPEDPLTGMRQGSRRVDRHGRVTFDRLVPGRHHFRLAQEVSSSRITFRAMDQELDPAEWTSVTLASGERREVTIEVEGKGSLTGVVTEDGVPLAGATVDLAPEGDDEALGRTLTGEAPGADTDGAGRYELRDVAPGRYDVEVRHPGRNMPHRAQVTVRTGEQTLDLELPVSVLAGRVLDDEGAPAVGAKVLARRAGEGRRPQMLMVSATSDGGDAPTMSVMELGAPTSVTTDADGRFRLRGVEGDLDLVVEVTHAGFRRARTEPLSVPAGGERDGIEVRLERGGAIEVVLEGAEPGGAYMISCNWAVEGEERAPKVEVLQNGRAKFEDLDPGLWEVSVNGLMGGGEDEEPIPPQTVEVQRGETTLARFER